jgi:DNA-3-methyladenine glycosylase II
MPDRSLTSANLDEALRYLAATDSVLAELIDQYAAYPMQWSRSTDTLLSALSRAIFYQSVSIPSANAVFQRFLRLYPEMRFPTATELCQTPDHQLKQTGLSGAKVVFLKNVARAVLTGLPELDDLQTLNDETIIRLLTQIKGIGPWSVQMVLIFQLKRLDVLPTGDLGLRAAIRDLYGLDQLPQPKLVADRGEAWRPYRTVATWYLWQSRGAAARDLLQAWSTG